MTNVHNIKFQRRIAMPWTVAPCIFVTLFVMPGHAQDVARISSAVAFSNKGTVSNGDVKTATETTSGSSASTIKAVVAQPAAIDPLQPGGKLSTGDEGATSLILGTTGTARMGADTELQLPDAKTKEHSLEMLKGKLFLNISAEELAKRKAGEFRLKTPAALLAVKGTKFFAISANGTDIIGVHEGSVSVTEPASKANVIVPAGKAVSISAGQISSLREITDEERGYKSEFDASNLVRTPITTMILDDTGIRTGKETTVHSKVFSESKLFETTIIQRDIPPPYLRWYPKGSPQTRNTPSVTAELMPDGVYHYSWKYVVTSDEASKEAIKDSIIIELGDRDKNGRATIGTLVAAQFRVRYKNLSKIKLQVLPEDKNKPTILVPPHFSLFGSWTESTVDASSWKPNPSRGLNDILRIEFCPAGPEEKGSFPRRDTAVFDLTEFVLFSLPKAQ